MAVDLRPSSAAIRSWWAKTSGLECPRDWKNNRRFLAVARSSKLMYGNKKSFLNFVPPRRSSTVSRETACMSGRWEDAILGQAVNRIFLRCSRLFLIHRVRRVFSCSKTMACNVAENSMCPTVRFRRNLLHWLRTNRRIRVIEVVK